MLPPLNREGGNQMYKENTKLLAFSLGFLIVAIAMVV
jgi:hypothetical protein